MQAARTIRLGMWLVMGLQLLLAAGAIGILMRMTPALSEIMDHSSITLDSCQEMLAVLAASDPDEEAITGDERFQAALLRASAAATSTDERQALDAIAAGATGALAGDPQQRQQTITAITNLANASRHSMQQAGTGAQRLGRAGAWGVVFMALITFTVSQIILLGLYRLAVEPVEEIRRVLTAHSHGDTLRRCTTGGQPIAVRSLFNDLNHMLDRSTATTDQRA